MLRIAVEMDGRRILAVVQVVVSSFQVVVLVVVSLFQVVVGVVVSLSQ